MTYQIKWAEVVRFCDEDSGIVVAINGSNHTPFRRYSVILGVDVWDEDKQGYVLVRPVRLRIHDQAIGRLLFDNTFEVIARLMRQAQDWIEKDAIEQSRRVVDEQDDEPKQVGRVRRSVSVGVGGK